MDETADTAEKPSEGKKKESFASDVLTLAGGTTFAQILTIVSVQYFTNWIRKSSSFIPISKYFSVKCLKS